MEKNKLLSLARNSIKSALEGKKFELDEQTKKLFSEKKACFVTITKNGNLRGCIGSLVPRQELWRDIIENAKNAAFNDPRFTPLSKKELNEIKIEISILSKPKKIIYNSLKELKQKIKDKGVIINWGPYTATYLPQVWEELNNEEEFLSSLCLKAGLNPDFWRTEKLEVEIYEAEKIKE